LPTYRDWKTHAPRKVAGAARSIGVADEGTIAAVEVAALGLAARILRTGGQQQSDEISRSDQIRSDQHSPTSRCTRTPGSCPGTSPRRSSRSHPHTRLNHNSAERHKWSMSLRTGSPGRSWCTPGWARCPGMHPGSYPDRSSAARHTFLGSKYTRSPQSSHNSTRCRLTNQKLRRSR
jgi:hypothetical protein